MPPISQTLALLSFAAMSSVPQEFLTVDMRGLKAALIERSRVDRVSVSSLVRSFVARGLGDDVAGESVKPPRGLGGSAAVKLSIRMSQLEAMQFTKGARVAGLSQAAYLAELIAGAPEAPSAASRAAQLSALVATNAELSTLSRNVRHLAALLGQGSVRAAQEYRQMLDTLTGDVRKHLSLASALMADMRVRRMPASSPKERLT